MSDRPHAVIIGGGVIGTACAHYLSKAGRRVTLLEKGQFGRQCSHGNCGLVCPSHVLPMATPGAFGFALKAMTTRNSPFYIKPRINLTLWRWLLGFAKRCNKKDMMASGVGIDAILQSSRKLYAELVNAEGIECEWQTRGLLFVFHSKHGMDHYGETNKLLSDEFNVPAKPYYGDALSDLEPALKTGLGGGWLYEGDAHLRPDRLMSSWRKRLEATGASVRENCEVKGFARENGKAKAVVTNQGEIVADEFVLAAGALSPFLNDHLGCRIPIQPGKGYSVTMHRPAKCPVIPMIFEEHRVAVTPFDSGYRIGSMMEFVGYDETINPKRLEWLAQSAGHYLHEPSCNPVEETWYGWRPMTTDSRPIIDRSPALKNVVIAAGHNMLGLSMAPATGKLVTELFTGEKPHLDPTPYAAGRF